MIACTLDGSPIGCVMRKTKKIPIETTENPMTSSHFCVEEKKEEICCTSSVSNGRAGLMHSSKYTMLSSFLRSFWLYSSQSVNI